MRLQYRYFEYGAFQSMIQLYCDGRLVELYKVYLDELDDEINKIEKQGYSYGFTASEVCDAKERYERMLNNIIYEV